MKHLSALVLSSTLTVAAQAQLTNGLIAYYPFINANTSNQSGTSFSTLFAQNTTGTANVLGAANQALAFSGNSPQLWVDAHDLIDFGTTTSFSFVTDFKSGSAAEQNFFRDLLANGHGWQIGFYNSTGYVTFETGTGSTAISIHTTATYNDLQWHQVALLVNKADLTIQIYVDYALQELTGTVCGAEVNGTSIDISTCNFNANEDNDQLTSFGEDLVGALDEIRLYGRLLTEEEVGQAYVLSFGTTEVAGNSALPLHDRFDAASRSVTLSGFATGHGQVAVFDEQGRMVMNSSLNSTQHRIDMTGLAAGIYAVRCTQGKGMWTKRYAIPD
ncbi:MAG: T9SS type A sorting domain-containing protein [Flavobacteriales bacterium]|nr:T9SS type A sorting domain-containing protein [Flavobacteriales bacterium]